MISDDVFLDGISILKDHFGKALHERVIPIWSEYLNEHLDDEAFNNAIKLAIIGLDFFPNAKKLVEFATASSEVQAMADWQIILAAAKTSNELWQQEILQSLKGRAHLALAALGGLQPIALADEWQLNKLEKKFVTIYCESPHNVRFLPPAPTTPSNSKVVDFPQQREPIDLSKKPPSIRRILEHLNLRSQGVEIPEEQVYANTFARYGWEIDSNRLNHFLTMDLEAKQQFLTKFQFAMKNKSSWRSVVSIFDQISGYKASDPEIDAKAIAEEWLSQESTVQF
jgi:hypothetical protein